MYSPGDMTLVPGMRVPGKKGSLEEQRNQGPAGWSGGLHCVWPGASLFKAILPQDEASMVWISRSSVCREVTAGGCSRMTQTRPEKSPFGVGDILSRTPPDPSLVPGPPDSPHLPQVDRAAVTMCDNINNLFWWLKSKNKVSARLWMTVNFLACRGLFC